MSPPPMRRGATGIPEHGLGSGRAVPVTVVAGSALGLAADGVACNMLMMGWWRGRIKIKSYLERRSCRVS